MADLEELARRVEAEEPSFWPWWESYKAATPEPDGVGATVEWMAWKDDATRFCLLMDRRAYRDAAAMLMPVGWYIDTIDDCPQFTCVTLWRKHDRETAGSMEVTGPHAEARARLAAALRAHAASAARSNHEGE